MTRVGTSLGSGLALGASLASVLTLLACPVPTSFSCLADSQCSGGLCIMGGCAFADGDCESGLRWGALAPAYLAGTCVGDEGVASGSETGVETATETGDTTTSTGDGDGDSMRSGDGDGDATTTSGDGDGDSMSSGDGDGDPTTTTTGDGDGDPTTTGDGDGDPGLPIPDTAIAHYSFDEINGATIVDATGNGYDAELDNNQSTAPAIVGDGLEFENLDRVIVPPAVLAGEQSFTVEFYMRNTQEVGLRQFVFYYGSVDGSPPTLTAQVEYFALPQDTGRFVYTGGGNNTVGVVGTTNLNDADWHHVALSIGPSGMRMYVDHFLENSDPFNPGSGIPGYAWIQLGGVPSGFGSFIGMLDEVRLSEGELSVDQMMPTP